MIERRSCASCGARVGVTVVCAACGRDPDEGSMIDAKFRIDLRLGQGGMSRVYRGVHVGLDEPVAIKFLRPELALDPVLRERFRREAVALARLRHPAIVSILDYGEAAGQPYVVMELVDGVELDQLAGVGQPLPLLRAGPIFDQVLAALETCHEAGVVHRDLKPANILVTRRGESDYATVIDFGLARTTSLGNEKLTTTGVIQGTPNYMAPEQCRGEEVSAPADIYALGITLFEILTGVAPFHASDAATYMVQHLFVEPPPIRALAPALPLGLEELVRAALAKSPDRRPTALELRHELAAVLRGTDRHAIASTSSAARRREGTLSRAERALTGHIGSAAPAPLPVAGAVHAWLPRGPRATSLLGALGAAGVSASLLDELTAPIADVVVVSSIHEGAARLARLRAEVPRCLVVVVDVRSVQETSALVRAGAADVALDGTPDAEVIGKIRHLLRRARRTKGIREE